jgi:hypothetical protein
MPRGGKREGAGRKAQGVTRKVSLRLSPEEWAHIDASGQTVSAYLQQRMNEQAGLLDKCGLGLVGMQLRDVQDFWNHYLDDHKEYDQVVLEVVRRLMFEILFPNGAKTVEMKGRLTYVCPFTGKCFTTMDELVRVVIDYLISFVADQLQKDQKESL